MNRLDSEKTTEPNRGCQEKYTRTCSVRVLLYWQQMKRGLAFSGVFPGERRLLMWRGRCAQRLENEVERVEQAHMQPQMHLSFSSLLFRMKVGRSK